MVQTWFVRHKKQVIAVSAALVVLIVIAQITYSNTKLLPFTKIDNVAVGGWQKEDAVKELDKRYLALPVNIYFGDADAAYRSPKPTDLKLRIQNQQRVESMNYPWYLRLVPSSILWAHTVVKPSESIQYAYNKDATKNYRKTCLFFK